MPLPIAWWLAGLAVGGVAALVKAGSSDSSNSAESYQEEEFEDNFEIEVREKRERDKKLRAIRRGFLREGNEYGLDIKKSLLNLIDVEFIDDPILNVKLPKLVMAKKIEHFSWNTVTGSNGDEVENRLKKHPFIRRLGALEKKFGFNSGYLQEKVFMFISSYAVELKLSKNIKEKEKQIDLIDIEIERIKAIKKTIVRARKQDWKFGVMIYE